jgi:signal transduction histidine kinase
VLEDLGLATAIERLCEEFQTVHGVPVGLAMGFDPSRRFSPHVELCAFRVVQESLTNAAKHAAAARVDVRLEVEDRTLKLSVTDDGRGFSVDEAVGDSFGLNGMRERVGLLDGRFEISSRSGGGTTIRAELPVALAAADRP